jgi:hypothetical protein
MRNQSLLEDAMRFLIGLGKQKYDTIIVLGHQETPRIPSQRGTESGTWDFGEGE